MYWYNEIRIENGVGEVFTQLFFQNSELNDCLFISLFYSVLIHTDENWHILSGPTKIFIFPLELVAKLSKQVEIDFKGDIFQTYLSNYAFSPVEKGFQNFKTELRKFECTSYDICWIYFNRLRTCLFKHWPLTYNISKIETHDTFQII